MTAKHAATLEAAQLFNRWLFGLPGGDEGAADQAIGAVTGLELVELDVRIRQRGPWNPRPSLRGLARAGSLTHVIGACSCVADGYVRERAVRRLSECGDPRAIPFLLLRLNDWVEEVRAAARRGLERYLVPEAVGVWLENLDLVLRLGRLGREDHGPSQRAIFGLLMSPGARGMLKGQLHASSPWVRRAAFETLLAATPGEEHPGLVGEAMAAPDAMVRGRAMVLAREVCDTVALEAVAARGLVDPGANVRREAVFAVGERLEGMAGAMLMPKLTDPSAGVRAAAQFYLAKAGQTEFAEVYRRLIPMATGRGLVAAIAGLGETGSAADVGVLVRFLSHDAPTVRTAALVAMVRLSPEGVAEQVWAAFVSADELTSAAAFRLLRLRPGSVEGARLGAIIADRGMPIHARLQAMRLAADQPWWTSLQLILVAAGVGDPALIASANAALEGWQGSSGRLLARPARGEIAVRRAELDQCAGALRPKIVSDLRRFLDEAERFYS